jgi:hypothetical protein
MSTTVNNKNEIVKQALNSRYMSFNNVRVEKRGNYLVFRIGDYRSYNQAKYDLQEINHITKNAYIRKCDFLQDSAIYIQDTNSSLKHKNTIPVTSLAKNRKKVKDNKFGIDESLLP